MNNKIITSKIDDLIPDDKNNNKGTEYGNHLIEKSIQKFGAGRSILIDKNNRIIAGNKTIENAASVGIENMIIVETTGDTIVAVKRTDIDLDSAKGREMALADNATAKANIKWDEDVIKQLTDDFEIKAEEWGIELLFEEIEDAKEDDFIPNEIKQTSIVYGDIYQIGNHKLMCGDSRNSYDYKKLLNGKLADLIFTDPPYDLEDSYSQHIFDSAKEDCHIFIMNSDKLLIEIVNNGINWFRKFFSVDFRLARLVSNNQPMTRIDLIAEFCKGKTKFNNLYDGFSTLIECAKIHNDNDSINFGHKQAKRIELPATFIKHYSFKNELVCDFFGGSGSTMAACEQLNRICNMMELDPINCQIIIDRMKEKYGLNAVKIN